MVFNWDLLGLILIGIVAGFLNTVAGGGSILTLPALIFMGLPPAVANGTNRISILIQNAFSTAGFRSKGIHTFPFNIYLGISALCGSIIGAQIASTFLKGAIFNRILAVVLLIVVGFMAFKPKAATLENMARLTGKYLWISIIVFFFIGLYGGIIQVGIGFIILVSLFTINRLTLVHSNATKVVVVLIYTLGAVIVFAINDAVNWFYGLTLSLGSATGAWFGSRWSVKKGDGMVRLFLVVMVVLMSIKLWFPDLNPIEWIRDFSNR